MHEAIARKAGLAGTDHKYLGLIMEAGKLSAGQIAERTGLTTGAVTGLIDRLEKKKLVKRVADPADRRRTIVVADSKNALRLLVPIFEPLSQMTARLQGGFKPSELAAITRYFEGAVEVMRDYAALLSADSGAPHRQSTKQGSRRTPANRQDRVKPTKRIKHVKT